MAIKTLAITTPTGATGGATGSWIVVPGDFGSLISIEAISGGGGGSAGPGSGEGHGGGGGGYAKITGCTGFVVGATMYYYIGYGGAGGSTGPATDGGPTWLNIGSNSVPSPGSVSGLAITTGGQGGGFFAATGATGIALGGGASGAGAFIGSSVNGATGYIGGVGR